MPIRDDGLHPILLGKIDISGDLEIAWYLSQATGHYALPGVQPLDEDLTIKEHQVPPNETPTFIASS
jgi:hypothetical protein